MTKLSDMTAKRLFSINFFKSLKLPLGEMSFGKDFVNENCGDIYPVLEKQGDYSEVCTLGKYIFEPRGTDAKLTRLIGRHFPYATYEMSLRAIDGECGFSFHAPGGKSDIGICRVGEKLSFFLRENGNMTSYESDVDFCEDCSFIVTARGKCFDIYIKSDGYPRFIHTFTAESLADTIYEKVFKNTTAAVYFAGAVTVTSVSFYVDCGLSQADIRPVRYENGEVLLENGKVFLTASIRMQAQTMQGVFTWVPGTSDFELIGAIFYDAGDGMWGNDVAASLMYDRNAKLWRLWVCSFSRGHILGHAEFDGDIRYGVNVCDITLMEQKEGSADTDHLAKNGDEDPDFIYDEKNRKWYMSICRPVTNENGYNYRYFFFESDNPYTGYKHIGNTKCGADTGGSILYIDGEYVFVCGSCFDKRADYRIYDIFAPDNYSNMKFDYDDGGFRGWGTVIPIKKGARTVYYHLTFDRANASDYNWSYGNIYCFELE